MNALAEILRTIRRHPLLLLPLFAMVLLLACEEDKRRNRSDDDDDDGVGGGGAGIGGNGNVGGMGGDVVAGGFGGFGGFGGSPPPPCEYPPSPYGVDQGDTVGPALNWTGYRPYSNESTNIKMSEFHDCWGTMGINAIFMTTTQWLCPACKQEAGELDDHMAVWEGMGIQCFVLLLSGPDDQPADASDALAWKNTYNLHACHVVPDPSFKMVVGGSVGTPQSTIINPRNMEVVKRQEGYSGNFSVLENLAQQNANQ